MTTMQRFTAVDIVRAQGLCLVLAENAVNFIAIACARNELTGSTSFFKWHIPKLFFGHIHLFCFLFAVSNTPLNLPLRHCKQCHDWQANILLCLAEMTELMQNLVHRIHRTSVGDSHKTCQENVQVIC